MVNKPVAHRGLVYLTRLRVGNAKSMIAAVAIGLIAKINMQADDIIHQMILKFLNV